MRHAVVLAVRAHAVIRLLFGGHLVLYTLGFAVLGQRTCHRVGYVEHQLASDELVVVRALDEVDFLASLGNIIPEGVAVVRVLVGFYNDLNALFPGFQLVLGVLCFEARLSRFQPFGAEAAVEVVHIQLSAHGIDALVGIAAVGRCGRASRNRKTHGSRKHSRNNLFKRFFHQFAPFLLFSQSFTIFSERFVLTLGY